MFRPAWLPHNPFADWLVVKDGPDHMKLRALLSHAFTPKNIARLEPRIHEIAVELTESLRQRDEFDFISEFAIPFPARVIAEILGVDPALHARFGEWAEHIASISPIEPPEEYANAVRKTIADMERYLGEVIAARRAKRGDDIVGVLVEAEIEGARLTDADILAFLFILLPAGFETTRHLLANAMLNFLSSDEFQTLRGDRAGVPGFVEEVLRHDTSVQMLMRLTTREVELGGATIPAGSLVSVLLGAVGRDPAEVTDPERFDRTRENTSHISFGHGPHFCLGAALARLETRIGIEALLDRFAGFEPAVGKVEWNLAPTVRGPLMLPVRPLR
jgi:cytochrome P450